MRKAEVLAGGDNPRFVVPSMEAPTPPQVDDGLYGARGNGATAIKARQCDLPRDRASATTCLAAQCSSFLGGAADVLHHALRTQPLHHTTLAQAQPSTVILPPSKWPRRSNSPRSASSSTCPASCPVQVLLSPYPHPTVPRPDTWEHHVLTHAPFPGVLTRFQAHGTAPPHPGPFAVGLVGAQRRDPKPHPHPSDGDPRNFPAAFFARGKHHQWYVIVA